MLKYILLITIVSWANADDAIPYYIADLDGGIDSCQTIVYLMNAYARREIDVDFVISDSVTTRENAQKNVVRCFEVLRMNRNVSIYPGSYRTVGIGKMNFNVFGDDGFGDLTLESPSLNYLRKTTAAVRIAELIAENRNRKVNYIAIGTLTNLAIAMTLYENVPAALGNIYVVGGNFKEDMSENSFTSDPEAARIVLKTAKSVITLLTLKNCQTNNIDIAWRISLMISNPMYDLITRAEKTAYLNGNTGPYYVCGAQLVAALLKPNDIIAQNKLSNVLVNTCNNRGKIFAQEGEPNVNLIQINGDAYKTFFIKEFAQICNNYDCNNKYQKK